jgi:two-component system, chemotaxis family, sensor kinase CheA
MTEPVDASFEQFMDDYFAESEEHLATLHHDLLATEAFVDLPQIDRSLLDNMLRSLHSLKGLSGMVGLTSVEQLAHHLESSFRALRDERMTLTTEMMDTFVMAVTVLERVIAARRIQQPLPDTASTLAKLRVIAPVVLAPTHLTAPLAQEPQRHQQPEITLDDGVQAWQFVFAPAPALAQRGVNVSTIRDRLQGIGSLIRAAPRVSAADQVTFEFLVTTQASATAFAGWERDGLTWTPYAASPAPPELVQEPDLGGTATSMPPAVVPSNIVRVDLARLDEVMRMVGELVISRARLEDGLREAADSTPPAQWRALQQVNLEIERQLRDLREGVMRVRMVPIGQIFERMRFVVRGLARESKKTITLELSGQETEIDKFVVERMTDPLLHLVRNAVSHGAETATTRLAQHKPPETVIALRAATVGDTVVIEVQDNGPGIDAKQVAARARALGLLDDTTLGDGTVLDNDTILDLICAPGFSTRQEADLTSGRGVGMSVVRDTVIDLGGSLTLDTQAGRGAHFVIQLPLTLAIVDALIVSVGGQTFAIPMPSVSEVIEVQPNKVTALEGGEILSYRGRVLPMVHVARLFGLTEQPDRACYALVCGSEPRWAGIVVDRIVDQREIVVRAIVDPLVQVPGITGATELGDGQPILILDIAALMRIDPGR